MDDSGAILCQISHLKEMLDQVNEEIEANYQITREIESEIVKCSEIESALAVRESELTKTDGRKLTGCTEEQIRLNVVQIVYNSSNSRTARKHFKKELSCLKRNRGEILERMNRKRKLFCSSCLDFQKDMDKDNGELETLLLEKEHLENEIHLLKKKISSMQNSLSAFTEEVLEDLHNSNSALLLEIQSGNLENEKLLKDINELKTTLLATMTT